VSERAAFISAILAHWDDDTPRLVFADWLQEHGDEARAEVIRSQIEVAKLPAVKRAKSKPGKRAAALLNTHAADWRRALSLEAYEGEYDRGFLTNVTTSTCEFAARAPALLAAEPVGIRLSLEPSVTPEDEKPIPLKWVSQLAANPLLRSVVAIQSQSGGWGPNRFARLLGSPHLANLKRVELFEDVVGLAGVKAIVESPSAFVLESLDLNESLQGYGGEETDDIFEAVELLAAAPRFASLRHLGLMFNGLNDRSVAALLESKTLPRSMRLDLEDNEYNEERFAEALAERFTGGSDEGGE